MIVLTCVGAVVGSLGTILGLGGGFLLIPYLLLYYPGDTPETVTSISLAVIFANAASGSVAYARAKRIDFRSGIIFSIATIPGAILGALTSSLLDRSVYSAVFGLLMTAASVVLFLKPHPVQPVVTVTDGSTSTPRPPSVTADLRTGVVISIFVGFISSLMGLGGGIVHVPAMIHLLDFPVHIATATSHLVLAVTSFAGMAVHASSGVLIENADRVVPLAIGAVIGAQAGARISRHIHGSWIIRGLAVALVLAGIRFFVSAL